MIEKKREEKISIVSRNLLPPTIHDDRSQTYLRCRPLEIYSGTEIE